MTERKKRYLLIGAGALALFAGAFFIGIGLGTVIENLSLRNSYENSSVNWKQELAAGAEGEQVRDQRNQEMAENMQYVSVKKELLFADGRSAARADIEVDFRSDFGCTLSVIRDATGELLYKSGLIDPGHYIETIRLSSEMKNGYYPCTAVWSFYSDKDEYVGEVAGKVVVIIGE